MEDLWKLAKSVDEIAVELGFTINHRLVEYNAFYEYNKRNQNGERLIVEMQYCHDDGKSKNSLPRLWKEHGFTEDLRTNWWGVSTFVYDKDDHNCYGGYNPTSKFDLEKKRSVIDFDWLLPATPENFRKLLEQILYAFNY